MLPAASNGLLVRESHQARMHSIAGLISLRRACCFSFALQNKDYEFGDGTKSQYSIVAAYHFPELAGFMKTSSGNYRFLIVPFTDSVGKTLQTGSLSGSRVMRSDRSRIEFTPGATWSTGSYSIHVYNLSMKVLTQWKAKFAVQQM